MPIILTCDGPSLGGFVCPATTILADMWKWGQARPGDKIQFGVTTVDSAVAQLRLQRARFAAVKTAAEFSTPVDESALQVLPPVLRCHADSTYIAVSMESSTPVKRVEVPKQLRVQG